MNVAHLLEEAVAGAGTKAALVERRGGHDLVTSYRDLDALSRRAAASLRAAGVGAGDPVLFFALPGRELYAALVATFRLGAVAMFVEPSAGRRVLEGACDLLAPRAFVGSPKAQLLRLVSSAVRRIPAPFSLGSRLPLTRPLFAAAPLHAPVVARDGEAPALVTFTSGSTGLPKGAIRTHAILRAQLDLLADVVLGPPEEPHLVALPIVVLLGLARARTVILPDADLRRPGAIDPGPVLEQLRRHRATRLVVAPAFLDRLEAGTHGGREGALAGVETVVTGGGPVFPDLVDRVRAAAPAATVRMVYGSTEAEPIAHLDAQAPGEDDRRRMLGGGGLPAGPAARGVTLRLIRSTPGVPIGELTGREFAELCCTTEEPGEIVVTGPHVVRGYVRGLGDADTKFRVDGAVWHRTGDGGVADRAGGLWLLGRLTEVVRDERGTLSPFAVEAAARGAAGGRGVVAALVGRTLLVEGASSGELATIRSALDWARLDDVRAFRGIPMDRRHNAKVDYARLRRRLGR